MENKHTNISPDVDIIEQNNEVLLYADLPGVHEKDLDVTFEKGILKIFAKRQSTKLEGFQQTFGVAPEADFERSFTVSKHIDPEGFSAHLADGVLRISMKKVKELQPKRITVKTA